ncbi:MAG TPA: hypothetical protein PLI46_13665 [Methanosarcina thermophila]|nr:hypothetical protein [Methanosarcina thermophila]
MPSLSELEARYNAFHGKEVHYLADLWKEPEAWHPEHTERRA